MVRKKGIVKIIFQYFLDHLKKESEKKIKVKTKLGKEGLGLDSEIIRTQHIRLYLHDSSCKTTKNYFRFPFCPSENL